MLKKVGVITRKAAVITKRKAALFTRKAVIFIIKSGCCFRKKRLPRGQSRKSLMKRKMNCHTSQAIIQKPLKYYG